MKATLIKRITEWVPTFKEEFSEKVIEADNEDDLLALFFREFDNRYKYCNNIQFSFKDDNLKAKYRVWLSDINNYANNGGDMW